jgi:serine/threonine protein kinase
MQAEVWQKIEELFHAALAEPPDQRAEFLRKACPDAQVRARVESLLEQADGSFLEGSPLPPAVRPGVKLGNFEIVELLGRGGMGEVWRARDSRLKRDVAIKLLPVAFARDPDRIARFEHEARAASALNHPNIVSVFDIGREDGACWIVSELVDGESLRALIGRGPLTPRKVIEIGAQIAEGLAAAHAAGIVHRDLKPGNIMVRRDGGVKIVDFGLAKRDRATAESTTLTDAGTVVGTAGYMSPEQVRGEAVDARSDIFSFGVILYEMLSGRQAFTGSSSVEVMNAILKDEPPELSGAPPALDRIVRRCLEKENERRFQGAADLGFALTSSLAAPLQSKPPKRRRWLTMAIAAAALLAAAGVSYWIGRSSLQPVSTLPDGTFRQLTNDAGLTTNAVISPDGKLVAYASDRADPSNLDIWVQQADGGHPVRITDDPADDDDPAFSPDGSQIAFRSDRKERGIYIVPALGGLTRLLIPNGRRPRFSPNGQMLMYQAHSAAGEALFVQPLAGGTPVPIGATCNCGDAVWSPDSTRILFIGFCPDGHHAWISRLDGKRVPSAVGIPYGPLDQWVGNPSRILSAMSAGNGSSIVASPVSADGARVTGPWQRITFGTGAESRASAASNGRIAMSSLNTTAHIWALPIDAGGHVRGALKQLTTGPGETYPTLARAGGGLTFSTLADGALYYRDLETGRQTPLSLYAGSAVFNPDGTRIIYSEETSDFYEVPIQGGIPRKVWSDPKEVWLALWDRSPDGATLLYNPGPVVRQLDLGVMKALPFLEDPEYAIWQAHFSHDGRWVTFNAIRDGRSRVFATPFRKSLASRSEWVPITDGPWDDKPHFSYDDRLLFFLSNRDGYLCIWAQHLAPDMHPVGSPFAVYHAHRSRQFLSNSGLNDFQMDVGRSMIVLDQAELTGNVWLFEPAKAAGK